MRHLLELQDKKGKGRPIDWAAEVAHEERALEVLIGMTGKTLCRRSNSHLENALLLVEVSLGHANLHWGMLVEQHHAKKAAAAEAKKAADAAKEAEAKKAAEAKDKTQSDQPEQGSTADAVPSDTAAAAQPAASTTSASAQQGTAGTPAAEPSTTAGDGTATAAAQPGDSSAAASAPDASSSGQAAAADVSIPDLNEQDNPGLVIQSLPEHLLKQLAHLLGQSGLSDLAQKRCASVIRMLVETCPQLKPLMLSELQNELQR